MSLNKFVFPAQGFESDPRAKLRNALGYLLFPSGTMIKVTGACDARHLAVLKMPLLQRVRLVRKLSLKLSQPRSSAQDTSPGAFADRMRWCHPRWFDKLPLEKVVVNVLIATMRAILIATGITPPTPENERKVLLILFLILIGLVLGTWLTFKYLVPLMA